MAPRRSKSEPAEKPTTPAFSLYATATATAGKSARVMSLSQVAILLDVSRNTVMRWISDGCPVEKAPPAGAKGVSYELDLAAIVRWLQAQAVEEAKRKLRDDRDLDELAGLAGDGVEDPKETVRLAILQIKLLKDQKTVVLRDHAIDALRRALGVIRQAVKGIPARTMGLFPGLEPEDYRTKYAAVTDFCIAAVEEGEKALREFDASTASTPDR